MESSNLMEGGSNEKLSFSGFFNHVFNFDHDNKSNMLNMIQYILIALIPVVFKAIKIY